MNAVAIDGPAGAGKTTVARRVAEELGWEYLDTGAMYRGIALAALQAGIDPADEDRVVELARTSQIAVSGGRVLVGGKDVTADLRRPDVTEASSIVSTHPEVREIMVDNQRRMAASGPVVVEGRDIGTVVLPEASVKVYLTATLDERAARRAQELDLHREADSERVKRAIAGRDQADRDRAVSPLKQAADAVLIDSSGRSVDEIVHEIVSLVEAGEWRGERRD